MNPNEAGPIFDDKAERMLVACLMRSPDRIGDVAEIVAPADVYGDFSRTLYQSLLDMTAAGLPIDPYETGVYTVKTHPRLNDDRAWPDKLAATANLVATGVTATHYAERVRRFAIRRSVALLGTDLFRRAHDGDQDAGDLLTEVETLLLAQRRTPSKAERIGPIAERVAADIARRRTAGVAACGAPIGLPSVDNMLRGLRPGTLTVLAARTSVGKSVLAVQACESAALAERGTVLLFSLEMIREELAERLLAGVSGVRASDVASGILSDDDMVSVRGAAADMHRLPLVIDDRAGVSVADIASAARRHALREPVALIVVDYLQRLKPSNHRDQRYVQVGEMMRGLKTLAGELKIPVMTCAQLGRRAEDAEPNLGDLRESGDIEQDADAVLLLHRPGRAEQTTLFIAKNRSGQTGALKLWFDADALRFNEA